MKTTYFASKCRHRAGRLQRWTGMLFSLKNVSVEQGINIFEAAVQSVETRVMSSLLLTVPHTHSKSRWPIQRSNRIRARQAAPTCASVGRKRRRRRKETGTKDSFSRHRTWIQPASVGSGITQSRTLPSPALPCPRPCLPACLRASKEGRKKKEGSNGDPALQLPPFPPSSCSSPLASLALATLHSPLPSTHCVAVTFGHRPCASCCCLHRPPSPSRCCCWPTRLPLSRHSKRYYHLRLCFLRLPSLVSCNRLL